MKINGANGANTQIGQMGMNQAADSYSRNIQNQIANAQKQLQELSSNEEMTLEEKMKKRQEIQQQINDLNMQLRQHQMEQRRAAMGVKAATSGPEKQQAKASSMDDMPGGAKAKAGKTGSGLSQASMTAMISADSSMKQAKVQGSMATQMEGKAGVLESEIKMDKGRGASTEKKEEELADLQAKAQAATAAQVSTLADASKAMEEAAAAERTESKASGAKEEKADQAESRTEKTTDSGADGEKAQDGIFGTDAQMGNAKNVQQDSGTHTQNIQPAHAAAPETQTVRQAYAHVDVRL